MTRRHLVCAGLSILLGAGVAAQRPGGNGGEDGAGEKFLKFLNFDILSHFACPLILSYFCFFKKASISLTYSTY